MGIKGIWAVPALGVFAGGLFLFYIDFRTEIVWLGSWRDACYVYGVAKGLGGRE